MSGSCPPFFRFLHIGAIIATIGIGGCGDDSTVSPTTVEPTFSSIQANIFAKNCTTSSCHGALGGKGGLVLEKDVAYNNLVGVTPENFTAQSKGLRRVVPSKPDSSFLLKKLTGPEAGEGDRMPQSNPMLDAQMIEAVRKWIEQGAKND